MAGFFSGMFKSDKDAAHETAPAQDVNPATVQKKIKLKFAKIPAKQLKEIAKDTLRGGGMDIPDTPEKKDTGNKQGDNGRRTQLAGLGGDLSGIFNRAAEALPPAADPIRSRPRAPSPGL